ncbi:WXG100 family type VII secretion target [Streptomyces sp. NPDC048717]|uniref:WXG100 family type VII secretion target n=1 Tax=unclassified Streptomyces TaxID=2593676 RepID=UPI0034478D8A
MGDNFSDGYIHVDYNHMQNAADDMVHQTKAIAQTITNLNAELQALMDSWGGDDAKVYIGKQDAWNTAVDNMKLLLKQNADVLTDVSGNYKYTENSLSQMWSDVKIGR